MLVRNWQTRTIRRAAGRTALRIVYSLILSSWVIVATGCQTLNTADRDLSARGPVRDLIRQTATDPHWGMDSRARAIERNLDSTAYALP